MTTTIYNIFSPHIPDWQKYALRYFEEHLEAVNLTGVCHLDEQETPELPRQIFMQLNDDWAAEPELVNEIVRALQSDGKDLALADDLRAMAAHLREIEGSLLSNLALEQEFEAAKEETLWEKLTDSNYKDILAFYQELSTTLHRAMFEATEWHMAKILDEVITKII